MKILLATSQLAFEAGSEIWTLTMLKFLRMAGHTVHVFTVGQDVLSGAVYEREGHYDLAIISHTTAQAALASWPIKRRIRVCHGVAPELEQPTPGADCYVAISENIARHMAAKSYTATVIRNPIDFEAFHGRAAAFNAFPRVAFMCSGRGAPLRSHAWNIVQNACLGLEVEFLKDIPHRILPCVLRGFNVVIGIGRCLLEAAACNRAVVSFDYGNIERCGYGAITTGNFHECRRDSFSGIISGRKFSPSELREEIEIANYRGGGLRPLLTEDHEGQKVAAQFLALAS